jgi:2-polyprenyl-3-methyl-5-hydroxy-6-metoxy-1,4-benzoquinol methylase
MSLLNELGKKYRTDKSTDGKRPGDAGRGHDYLRMYERFLEADRHRITSVLEIGVQRGASLYTWQDYFPNARIHGIDIAESALRVTGDRITIRLVDQSDAAALEQFAKEFGPFDVVIEDGSHIWDHQITSLQVLLKHVKPSGKYIVEDLQTSYSEQWRGNADQSAIQYLLQCVEKVLAGSHLKRAKEDRFMAELNDLVDSVMAFRHAAVFFRRP